MSRIGNLPIPVPEGVAVAIRGCSVFVEGPKGSLSWDFVADMQVELVDNVVVVKRPSDQKKHKSLHGLTRTYIANMVEGVTKGFSKELEVNGVGYRASKQGKNLVMILGYSHQVTMPEVDGITVEVPNQNKIIVYGIDKQKVGQFAADVRCKRPPEPYKGKGIKYVGEVIRRKAGKAGQGKK
ncbi:MAG: 50S ribosomal protein L6 [Oscillospiraceae bacterium]|nr:50S ribosomal protein L6 [Oscillospiraceae bacterium]